MWSHSETETTNGPQNLIPADIDISFYQETSMNHVAMQYNKKNTENTDAQSIYNDINRRDTAIMISKRAAARIRINDTRSIKHALLGTYADGLEWVS